jgi:N-acyl-D-amino-acid deacylase
MKKLLVFFVAVNLGGSCKQVTTYDIVIRNGMVYDGNGGEPFKADIGINADTIAFIGDLKEAKGKTETDAKGMAVAPGFINMLSWANESLIQDGRSQGDIRQGVTLEVMGEGGSMGPLTPQMKKQMQDGQSDIKYTVAWNTLGEYLDYLQKKGISCNVASFIGATTVREYVVGEDNRDPSPAELDSMRLLVKQAMEEGAMGVGSSLIYPPAFFAKTNELVALCEVAGKYGGSYISHMRSEGNKLTEAVEELITIAQKANVCGYVYVFSRRHRPYSLHAAIAAGWWVWQTASTVTGSRYPAANNPGYENIITRLGKFILCCRLAGKSIGGRICQGQP